jgi:hypothetical protein
MSKLKEDLAYALLSNNPIDTIIEIKKGVPTEKLHETLLEEYESMEEPLAHVIFKSCMNKHSHQNKNTKENIADVLLKDFNPEQMLKLAYSENAEKQNFIVVLSQYGKEAIKMLLKGQDAKTRTKLLEEDVGNKILADIVMDAKEPELSFIAFEGIGDKELDHMYSISRTCKDGGYKAIDGDNEIIKFVRNHKDASSLTIKIKPDNTVTMKTVYRNGESKKITISPEGDISEEARLNTEVAGKQHHIKLYSKSSDLQAR